MQKTKRSYEKSTKYKLSAVLEVSTTKKSKFTN